MAEECPLASDASDVGAKRPPPGRGDNEADTAAVAASATKRARLEKTYTQRELDGIVQRAVSSALAAAGLPESPRPRSALNALLQENFTPNDPVHGLIHLPNIVRAVVDTMIFQRMRHIKQLALCCHVYPGAVHDRFFHSIGTAFLAHELLKGLRERQPELYITDRDVLCATLAALCHDLGHPCFSHMFEVFVHSVGSRRRKQAEEDAKARGLAALSPEDEAEVRRYEEWTHENASCRLLELLFEELKAPLADAGLRVDAEGDDFACIRELIDPPKKDLEKLRDLKQLRADWSNVVKGRPVEKAWLYEVVSNWRSGIDVDKFDYFRRDALFLGIHREFDHSRYLRGLKVILDSQDVYTLSPPMKDKDTLRENVLELRKMLHRAAYQHKTVKKFELHMVDILEKLDGRIRIIGSAGKPMSISEAAVNVDPVAYVKLTDIFIETKLLMREEEEVEDAAREYDRRIVKRELMRLVGDWDLPRIGEEGLTSSTGPLPLPSNAQIIAGVHAGYASSMQKLNSEKAAREVPIGELRCSVAKFHYGMGSQDPIAHVVFHTKSDALRGFEADGEAKPLRQKIFVFWNPELASDDVTLQRLTRAFKQWAEKQVESHRSAAGLAPAAPRPAEATVPVRPRRELRIQASCPPDAMSPRKVAAGAPAGRAESPERKAAMQAPEAPPKRALKIRASCPDD